MMNIVVESAERIAIPLWKPKPEQDFKLSVLQTGVGSEDYKEAHKCLDIAFQSYRLHSWFVETIKDENQRNITKKEVIKFCTGFGVYFAYKNGAVLMCKSNEGNMLSAIALIYHPKVRIHWIHKLMTSLYDGFVAFVKVGISFQTIKLLAESGGLERFNKIDQINFVREKHFQGEPHLYLMLIGTLPESRGKGVGSTMLQVVNDISDDLQLPVYLETDEPELEAFYKKNGYETAYNFELKARNTVFKPNYGMLRKFKRSKSKKRINADERFRKRMILVTILSLTISFTFGLLVYLLLHPTIASETLGLGQQQQFFLRKLQEFSIFLSGNDIETVFLQNFGVRILIPKLEK